MQLSATVSEEFGEFGEPTRVSQEMIDAFAELTGDRQWIHVDVERARSESSFGGPIAHGFLTLSLLPPARQHVAGGGHRSRSRRQLRRRVAAVPLTRTRRR